MIKTIDIYGKEWFDKVNGNSYFSAEIIVNYCIESEERFQVPFSYGYGDMYIFDSLRVLKNAGIIETDCNYTLRQSGIILRTFKQRNCKKRELTK
jgi:hypothetical protein